VVLANVLSKFTAWYGAWLNDRREYQRLSAPPVRLHVGDQSFETSDWSLGGCRILASPRTFKRGARLKGSISVDGLRRGNFLGEIVHAAGTGAYGLRWLEISPAAVEAMLGRSL
jgi:hypothetical protein